jgi:uncharacterized protein YbjQ (UPF0145 family)
MDNFEAFVATTTNDIEGAVVVKNCGIVSSQVVMGVNIFKDIFASFRDFFGGRTTSYEGVFADAREEALQDLKAKARGLHANALIGVKFDYTSVGTKGSMLVVCATGTAVRVEFKK